MTDVVPERIRLDRHKVHFTALLESALDGPDLPMVRELLENPRAELGAYVRLDLVRSELLDRSATASRPAGWALDLWRLITLECWLCSEQTADLPERLRRAIDARAASYEIVEVDGD